MFAGRPRRALSLPQILLFILAGTIILSVLFFTFWQRLNRKVEDILKQQFNQQQLELARKIADNVEAYFDYLESELLAYPWRFRLIPPDSPGFNQYMQVRFEDLRRLGILEIRWYDQAGRLHKYWRPQEPASPAKTVDSLPPEVTAWLQNPQSKGRLFLGEVHRASRPPWEGRMVMPFFTGLYASPEATAPEGVLELLIDPIFIANKVTAGVAPAPPATPGSSTRTAFSWPTMKRVRRSERHRGKETAQPQHYLPGPGRPPKQDSQRRRRHRQPRLRLAPPEVG